MWGYVRDESEYRARVAGAKASVRGGRGLALQREQAAELPRSMNTQIEEGCRRGTKKAGIHAAVMHDRES